MNAFYEYAPTISLIFFFSVFVGVAIWALAPGRKTELQALADIPLKEDTHG